MNPNDMQAVFREHEMRVRNAERNYARQGLLDVLPATPLHRQWAARAGDVLVEIGSRLQAADDRRHVAARLDTLRQG